MIGTSEYKNDEESANDVASLSDEIVRQAISHRAKRTHHAVVAVGGHTPLD